MEDLKKITIGDLIKIFKKLKITTIVCVIGFIFSILSTAFFVGVSVARKSSGIDLKRPFNMRIQNQKSSIYLEGLTIFENPFAPECEDGKKRLVIYQDQGKLINQNVGVLEVKNKKDNLIKFTFKNLIGFNIIPSAYANADMRGYENNYNYVQRYISRYIIHRIYDDGSILEINLRTRTTKWIRKMR